MVLTWGCGWRHTMETGLTWQFFFPLSSIWQLLQSEFVSPTPSSRFICCNANVQCDGFRWWGLWEMIIYSNEGWALMNEIDIIIKKAWELSCSLHYVNTLRGLQPKREFLPNHTGTLISDLQPPKVWEINFCCLYATPPVVLCYSNPNRLRQHLSFIKKYSSRGEDSVFEDPLWFPTSSLMSCMILCKSLKSFLASIFSSVRWVI